jgi:hypothetical protein
MARALNSEAMNAPVWNEYTTVTIETLTGGYDQITVSGYYVIISNTGANNINVGPNNTTLGILVQPGGTFETAIAPGAALYVNGTATQTATVIQYA